MGGPTGGAERLEPGVPDSGGGAEKLDMELLKVAASEGVIGGGTEVKDGARVETTVEGTNGKGAEDIIGGCEGTGWGLSVENVAGGKDGREDIFDEMTGLDKAREGKGQRVGGGGKKERSTLEGGTLKLLRYI